MALIAMRVRPVNGVICRANTGSLCSSHFLPVAHAAIDDDAGKTSGLGRERGQAAKRRNALAGIVDDEHVPRRGRLDHIADLEILRPEVTALARDLTHRHRPADAARASHDLAEPDHDAGEGNIVERIGDGRRRQLCILRHDVINHPGSSLCPPAYGAPPFSYRPRGPRTTAHRGRRPPRPRKCLQAQTAGARGVEPPRSRISSGRGTRTSPRGRSGAPRHRRGWAQDSMQVTGQNDGLRCGRQAANVVAGWT